MLNEHGTVYASFVTDCSGEQSRSRQGFNSSFYLPGFFTAVPPYIPKAGAGNRTAKNRKKRQNTPTDH